jgi:hypothetical protein
MDSTFILYNIFYCLDYLILDNGATTFSIMTFSMKGVLASLCTNDTQHEWHSESSANMLSVFMLSVFMLSVFMLSVFMLSVFMLSVFMLSVVILGAVMLSVAAPFLLYV